MCPTDDIYITKEEIQIIEYYAKIFHVEVRTSRNFTPTTNRPIPISKIVKSFKALESLIYNF